MRKATKTWLIIATAFVTVGTIIFAAVLFAYHGDFTKFGTVEYETNTHEISEDFNNISIDSDVADIKFVLSEDDTCKVECVEEVNSKHTVTVKEDTLIIESEEDGFEVQIGINIGEPQITVYLPKMEYISLVIEESSGNIEIPKDFKFADADIDVSTGDVECLATVSGLLKIQTNTGSITVENISVGELQLSVTTGKVKVSEVICAGELQVNVTTGAAEINNVECKNLTSKGTTGDITLKTVIATEKLTIERSTGDVYFDNADAAEIFVQTDTGDVTGTLLSDKTFVAESDTGHIDVPKNTTGGRCEITTDTGDIEISILDWALWEE